MTFAAILAAFILVGPIFNVLGPLVGITQVSVDVNQWRVQGCPERWFEDEQIHYRCLPPGQSKPATARAVKWKRN